MKTYAIAVELFGEMTLEKCQGNDLLDAFSRFERKEIDANAKRFDEDESETAEHHSQLDEFLIGCMAETFEEQHAAIIDYYVQTDCNFKAIEL